MSTAMHNATHGAASTITVPIASMHMADTVLDPSYSRKPEDHTFATASSQQLSLLSGRGVLLESIITVESCKGATATR
jgi:hypothetical protein